MPAPTTLPPQHHLIEPLGRGSLGEAYLALHEPTGQQVILKLLSAQDPALRDAAIAAILATPSPEPQAPWGLLEGGWLTRPAEEGVVLRRWLERPEEEPPPGAALRLTELMAEAHRAGVAHGDLHPGNVILQPQGARIIDWGVGAARATCQQRGVELYAPPDRILPPEQRPEVAPTPAADVYALAALLGPLLAIPESTAPTQGNPRAPRDGVAGLLARMQAPDPTQRPSMEEVAAALRALAPVEAPVAPGPEQRIGGYRLLREVGRGGMGVVYEAVHERLSRRAAVKLLRPELAQDADMLARFFTEAEAVNVVHHPGIVSVFEFGQLPEPARGAGSLYIIMEYLEGDTLKQRLRKAGGALGLSALRVLRQVASALAAAHACGVVHRDIKPDNIMIIADPEVPGGERAKVMDFGIAKMIESLRHSRTQRGLTLGTPRYMSPEQQADAASVDERTDVFALGVMVDEVLGGAGGRRLRRLVARMRSPQPAERPRMREVAEQLEAALQAQSPGRWLLIPAAAALLAGALIAPRALHRPPPSPPPAAAPTPPTAPATPPPPVDLTALRVEALLVLQEGLRDADPAQRRRAVSALAPCRDARYGGLVSSLLDDPDEGLVERTALTLGQLGARELAPLLARRARGATPRLQLALAQGLTLLATKEASPLTRRLVTARDAELRQRASWLLAQQGSLPARRQLLQLPSTAPGALDELRVDVLARLASAGLAEAQQALVRLRGATALEPGTEAYWQILEALARLEEGSARETLLRLAQEEGPLRLRAARTLAALDEPGVCPQLLAAVLDAQRTVLQRVVAAEGTGACGLPAAAAPLAGLLPRDAAPLRLRLVVAGALLQIAALDPALLAQESLRRLDPALSAARWRERQDAVVTLGDSDPRLAVPRLGHAIADPQVEVRQSAARALGRTRVRAAVPVLGRALDDSTGGVRQEAMQSLGVVGRSLRQRGEPVADLLGSVAGRLSFVDRGAPPGQGRDERERLAGVAALLSLGDTSRRAQLLGWLKAPDAEIRRLAVEAWAADTPGPTAPLLPLLQDPSTPVRFAAAARLAERGERAAVPVLREALRREGPESLLAQGLLRRLGEPVEAPRDFAAGAAEARRALVAEVARLAPAEGGALLRLGARDPDPQVRKQVVESLGDHPTLLPPDGARRLLRGLLADPDDAVRARAQALLARLGLLSRELPALLRPALSPPPPQVPVAQAPAAPRVPPPARTREQMEAEERRILNNQIRPPKQALGSQIGIKEELDRGPAGAVPERRGPRQPAQQ